MKKGAVIYCSFQLVEKSDFYFVLRATARIK